MNRRYLPSSVAGVSALGAMIAEGRRLRGWTAADLAGRLSVSLPTLRRIEAGEPSVAIGVFFEAAVLCGVELFSTSPDELPRLAREAQLRTAVLPARVRPKPVTIDDNF
ncbi:Helix-turn-helix domain-containing protein [Frankineae bacterium MT45]|nr:Helix-turn-helix domain-containing protein [Frankineae bacterium MT45]